MRDPLRPIPSPTASRSFWDQPSPPPPPPRAQAPAASAARPSVRQSSRAADYDPTRLLRGHEADSLGLDRRAGRRAQPNQPDADPHQSHDPYAIVAAAHEQVDGILALSTVHGWALVRTLSLAPQGVLLRHVDALDRDLDPQIRVQIGQALQSLSPVLGAPLSPRKGRGGSSPLANLGTHLLGARVVADASTWASGKSTKTRGGDNLSVSLVTPPRSNFRARGLAQLAQIEGRLAPLNDPDLRVVAVALSARAVSDLRLQLRGARAKR